MTDNGALSKPMEQNAGCGGVLDVASVVDVTDTKVLRGL